MQSDQRAAVRSQLQEELAACRERVERLETSAAPVAPDSALGRLTRMESLNDQGVSQAALSQARERLYHLEQALEKSGHPGFGICSACGRAIPIERLLALPESTRCVPCASR